MDERRELLRAASGDLWAAKNYRRLARLAEDEERREEFLQQMRESSDSAQRNLERAAQLARVEISLEKHLKAIGGAR